MNLQELINKNLPIHPFELEQYNLVYMVDFAGLKCYSCKKENMIYAFTQHKKEPFLNYYHKYEKQ